MQENSVQDDPPLLASAHPKHASVNVGRINMLTALWAFSMSMWQAQMLSFYLYAINPDTRTVGIAEGVQGITRLVCSLLIGVCVDRLPRNWLITASGVLTIALHSWFFALVLIPEHLPGYPDRRMPVWYGSLALLAFAFALSTNLVEAVFADSVAHGDRVKPQTRRQLIAYLGLLFGPIATMIGFAIMPYSRCPGGDPTTHEPTKWCEETLKPIMLVGISAGLLTGVAMLTLDHRATLGAASEAAHVTRDDERTGGAEGATDARRVAALDAPADGGDEIEAAVTDDTVAAAAAAAASAGARSAACVRWTILFYDIFRLMSGGMVVKYWGLFFEQAYHLGPTPVLGVSLGTIVAMLLFTALAGLLSGKKLRLGRGAVCLGLLLLCDAANFATTYAPTVGLDAAAWVVREGSLNGVFGIKKTLLMDHTPKSARGRWNAIDNLQSGFFSGSAILSGFLIKQFGPHPLPLLPSDLSAEGYRAVFFFMSCGFVAATAVWLPLARVR